MKRFQDKVVIVTGGARGIGETTCGAFAKEGAKLVIADINEMGQEVSNRLNGSGCDSIFIKTDVTKEDEVISLIAKTVEKYGKLDVLVADAGVIEYTLDPLEQSEAVYDRTMDVNSKGVFLTNMNAIRQFIKQESKGAIVNVSSVEAVASRPNYAAYCGSKGAVKQMTQSFAIAFSARGVRVNSVCPGVIITPLFEQSAKIAGQAAIDGAIALHPIGRLGQPEEVASAILFLASEEASFITGVSLPVDGGYLAG